MVDFDYTSVAKTAKILLARYGRSITFVKLNEVSSDPDKPWNGPVSDGETLVSLKGISIDPIGQKQMGTRSELSNLIVENSNLLIVANEGNDLSQFSEVLDENKRFGITLVETLKPANLPIISYVWVKR